MNDLVISATEYDDETYHATSRAVGAQQWVADQWADGAVPLNSRTEGTTLRSSTGNFKGIQFADGSGKLKHYRHIEAIRTRSGLIISDTSCYARGWAHCSTPNGEAVDHSFDVTSLQTSLRDEPEDIYDIEGVDRGKRYVSFASGRVWSLAAEEWVERESNTGESPEPEANALGV